MHAPAGLEKLEYFLDHLASQKPCGSYRCLTELDKWSMLEACETRRRSTDVLTSGGLKVTKVCCRPFCCVTIKVRNLESVPFTRIAQRQREFFLLVIVCVCFIEVATRRFCGGHPIPLECK